MGYTTDFNGEFHITPILTNEHREYLNIFNKSRHMKRNPSICVEILAAVDKEQSLEKFDTNQCHPDKVYDKGIEICRRQIQIGLPIGEEGEYFLGLGNFDQVQDSSVLDYNTPPKTQPGLWCGWSPNERGDAIIWDECEKFYKYVEWIQYIIDHFMKRWSYVLNGEVEWFGEENDDRGTIYIKNNNIEVYDAEIVVPRPSWEK